jgi:hypothetical protein
MFNFHPLCHNGSKVRIMKTECKSSEEERGRFIAPEHRGGGLARSVWRPAEHIREKMVPFIIFPSVKLSQTGSNQNRASILECRKPAPALQKPTLSQQVAVSSSDKYF